MKSMAALEPAHFLWRMEGDVAVIQLARPERKNPLTFASYAELATPSETCAMPMTSAP
jgi:enoyl-CoA hydratase/carnithine racemase